MKENIYLLPSNLSLSNLKYGYFYSPSKKEEISSFV